VQARRGFLTKELTGGRRQALEGSGQRGPAGGPGDFGSSGHQRLRQYLQVGRGGPLAGFVGPLAVRPGAVLGPVLPNVA
jgi:hypothetical protein